MTAKKANIQILFKNGQSFTGAIADAEADDLVETFRHFHRVKALGGTPKENLLEFPGIQGFAIFDMSDISCIVVLD
jgi:hypothetical protein